MNFFFFRVSYCRCRPENLAEVLIPFDLSVSYINMFFFCCVCGVCVWWLNVDSYLRLDRYKEEHQIRLSTLIRMF